VDLISRFMQRPWDRTAMQVYTYSLVAYGLIH
jgi:hypothetical protein